MPYSMNLTSPPVNAYAVPLRSIELGSSPSHQSVSAGTAFECPGSVGAMRLSATWGAYSYTSHTSNRTFFNPQSLPRAGSVWSVASRSVAAWPPRCPWRFPTLEVILILVAALRRWRPEATRSPESSCQIPWLLSWSPRRTVPEPFPLRWACKVGGVPRCRRISITMPLVRPLPSPLPQR